MRPLGFKFMKVSCADLVDKMVGESERRISKLFESARAVAPSILLFDNIDIILGTAGARTSHQALDRVLSSFLIEIDKSRGGVIVLGTCSSVDLIDKALLRPGRLELHISLSYPDENQREKLIRSFIIDTCRGNYDEGDSDEVLNEKIREMMVIMKATSRPSSSPVTPADIRNVTREAAVQVVIRNHLLTNTMNKDKDLHLERVSQEGSLLLAVCDEVIRCLGCK